MPWIGLLDELGHLVQPAVVERIVGGLGGDDTVAARLLIGDLHDRDDRAVGPPIGVDQLADAWPVADHDVVRQDHREWLVADEVLAMSTAWPKPSCSF